MGVADGDSRDGRLVLTRASRNAHTSARYSTHALGPHIAARPRRATQTDETQQYLFRGQGQGWGSYSSRGGHVTARAHRAAIAH